MSNVLHIHLLKQDFNHFYHFPIRLWNCSDSVVFFLKKILFLIGAQILLVLCYKYELSPLNKNKRKPKGQSRMDNPETLATLGTSDTGGRQTKQ